MNSLRSGFAHKRVVSGLRTTGSAHLGHYHGVLKNWVQLQHEYECYFFAADWHALTTDYATPETIGDNTIEMVIDWLASGVNPGSACLFVQSKVPEHAELYLLLSMMTPLSWLERVPTYKDQQVKLQHKDLSTCGFLGYPLLQAADILAYNASLVPVGEDQVPHVEFCREVARRFNHLYGKGADFLTRIEAAIDNMGQKQATLFKELTRQYKEQGSKEALEKAQALLNAQLNLSIGDRQRLMGFLEGGGKRILVEPESLLTPIAKMPGLDGQKMSKSYGNTIGLRESPKAIETKIRHMTTDPARIRREDPGNPEVCPVFGFHKIYSDEAIQTWASQGCKSAGIGCVDCKKKLCESLLAFLEPIQKKGEVFSQDKRLVQTILQEGSEKAREVAKITLNDVKKAMGIN